VIVHGGIDLSIGSAVALATVVVALTLRAGHGPLASAAAGVLATTAIGAVTGFVIARFRLAPFIVTLATMTILRGVAKGLADEQKIDADPRGLDALMITPASGLPVAPGVLVAAVLAVVFGVLLHRTRFGVHVFAVGSNERTARLCGIEPAEVRIVVYTLAGLLTGVAGVLEYATLTVGDPTGSVGLELEAIASVVIGGASLAGGEGSVTGAVVGALLMTVIKTGCTHMGLPTWVQEIVTGGIIAAAVALDRLRARGGRGE
jgi:ribose transport system permease protein